MPVRVGIIVDEVRCVALTGLLTGGLGHDQRYLVDTLESSRSFHLGHVLVPGSHGSALTQVECAFVRLSFSFAYGILDDGIGALAFDSHLAEAVGGNDGSLIARRRNGSAGREVSAPNGTHKETHDARRSLNMVLSQRRTLSATVTAKAHYGCVDVDIRSVARRQLVGMRSQHDVERAPWQYGGGHTVGGDELDAVARSVGQGGPAHILAVGHVLRFAKVDKLVFHRALVKFDKLPRLAVIVVIDRSATVVGVVGIIRIDLHGVTDAGQVERRIVGADGRREFDTAVDVNCPVEGRVELKVIRTERLILVVGDFVRTLVGPATYGGAIRSLRLDVEREHHGAVLAGVAVGRKGAVLQVVQAVLNPSVESPVVVVGLRAIGVELGSVAVGDDAVTVIYELADSTGLLVETHAKLVAHDVVSVVRADELELSTLSHRSDGGPAFGFLHQQLFLHLHIAFLGPRHVLAQLELHFDEVLRLSVERGVVVGQGVVECVAGAEDHTRTHELVIALYGLAVLVERPSHLIVRIEGNEVVLVGHAYLSLRHVDGQDGHVLVDLLHLVVLRFRRQVGVHHTVEAEGAVVGLVAEVTAIGDEAVARLFVIVVDAVVNPLPDGTATEEVGRLDSVPVVHKVARGVTHRVAVFGDVERVFQVQFSSDGLPHPVDGGVLIGTHVDDVVVALILYGTRCVESLDGVIGGDEVVAGAGFVTEAPDDDGGVVDRGVDHLHVAGNVGGLPFLGVRERLLTIIILMAFDVGLVLEIDAILVTEVVPVRRIGVVRAADVVDVGALHEHDFLFHLLAGDGVAAVGAGLVAVDAFELHGAAVDVEVAAGEPELVVFGFRVLNLHFAETDGGRNGLDGAAFLVFEFADEGVAPGFFG